MDRELEILLDAVIAGKITNERRARGIVERSLRALARRVKSIERRVEARDKLEAEMDQIVEDIYVRLAIIQKRTAGPMNVPETIKEIRIAVADAIRKCDGDELELMRALADEFDCMREGYDMRRQELER